MFVRRVIVHDDMHLQIRGHSLVNLSQEIQIFLMAVTSPTVGDHFAIRRIRGSEQRGGAMPSIIVSHPLHVA